MPEVAVALERILSERQRLEMRQLGEQRRAERAQTIAGQVEIDERVEARAVVALGNRLDSIVLHV